MYYDYYMRGSVTAVLGPDGTYTKGYDYDEFGNSAGDGDSGFYSESEFTGAVSDTSSGLYYMNARYDNPSTGRFLTQDAVGGDNWTNNLYSYGKQFGELYRPYMFYYTYNTSYTHS